MLHVHTAVTAGFALVCSAAAAVGFCVWCSSFRTRVCVCVCLLDTLAALAAFRYTAGDCGGVGLAYATKLLQFS
jgi:hypothetical protein